MSEQQRNTEAVTIDVRDTPRRERPPAHLPDLRRPEGGHGDAAGQRPRSKPLYYQ